MVEMLQLPLVRPVVGIQNVQVLCDHQGNPGALERESVPRIGVDNGCPCGRRNPSEQKRIELIQAGKPRNLSSDTTALERLPEATREDIGPAVPPDRGEPDLHPNHFIPDGRLSRTGREPEDHSFVAWRRLTLLQRSCQHRRDTGRLRVAERLASGERRWLKGAGSNLVKMA